MKNCPHVLAPYAFSPSSLVICSSERKKNEVCGLMSIIALWEAVFFGPTAKPLEPVGSSGGASPRGAPAGVAVDSP